MGSSTGAGRVHAIDPAALARWRGRAVAIEDVATLPAAVVFEALKTEPELDDDSPLYGELDWPAIMMLPLGLHRLSRELDAGDDDTGQTNHVGIRMGRPVLLRHGAQDRGGRSAYLTWIGVATPEFSILADRGELFAEDRPPEPVTPVLARLAPAPAVWRDVHVVGGREGIVAKRPIQIADTMTWVYDLWLAERLADAATTATLTAPDPHHFVFPYGLGHARRW
jgi:hypothetical protein